jgi:hypothetical protein
LAAASVGDRLGLGKLAALITEPFRDDRDEKPVVFKATKLPKGSRSASLIGGVATAPWKDACAAVIEGLGASSNDGEPRLDALVTNESVVLFL